MKKIIILLVAVFTINAVKGQLVNQWMYGDTGNCSGFSIKKTFDGGFLLAGNKNYTSDYSFDLLYILKTNSSGDTLWTKSFEIDSGSVGSCVQTYDSGFVFTGAKNQQLIILKINKSGDSLWTQKYNLGNKSSQGGAIIEAYNHSLMVVGMRIDTFGQYYPGEPIGIRTDEFGNNLYYINAGGGSGYACDIIETQDSNFVVSYASIWQGPPQPLLLKEDINGQYKWGNNYPGSTGCAVTKTTDNGLIISGQNINNNYYLYLIKTDSVGNIVWNKTDSAYNVIPLSKVIQTNDGGYLFVGKDTLVRLTLFKVNNQGNYQWSKSYAGYGTATGASVVMTNNNGFAIIGSTHNPTTNKDEMYFIITDSLGNTMSTACSAQFDLVADTTTPHNYFAVNNATGVPPLHYIWSWGDGSANDTIAYPSHTYSVAGFYSICLTIIDSTGCTYTYCNSSYLQKSTNSMVTINVILHGTLGINTNELSNQIKVYPNPTKDNLTIETNSTKEQRIEIVNLIGQTVYTTIINKKAIVNTSSFPSGVYILKLYTDKETVVRKFVKE